MGFQVLHTNPDGMRMMVSQQVLGLDKAIKEGDATLLWPGDERMFLVFNRQTNLYEVWRACEDNVDRIICSWPPDQMDARLIKHIASIDSRTRDVLKRIDAENDAVVRDRDREAAAALESAADYLEYVARRSHLPGHEPRYGRPLNATKKGSPK